jgi:hypothetical protein
MTIRTSRTTVTFRHPFRLDGFNEAQPAGDYTVDVDEEMIEGLSFLAYRRVAALVHLPAIATLGNRSSSVSVSPCTFDAMLELDHREQPDG